MTHAAASATRLELLAGRIVQVLFALVLFSTVITVSANGDFITAGY